MQKNKSCPPCEVMCGFPLNALISGILSRESPSFVPCDGPAYRPRSSSVYPGTGSSITSNLYWICSWEKILRTHYLFTILHKCLMRTITAPDLHAHKDGPMGKYHNKQQHALFWLMKSYSLSSLNPGSHQTLMLKVAAGSMTRAHDPNCFCKCSSLAWCKIASVTMRKGFQRAKKSLFLTVDASSTQ